MGKTTETAFESEITAVFPVVAEAIVGTAVNNCIGVNVGGIVGSAAGVRG